MRVGSLIKHIQYGFIGVISKSHPINGDGTWFVVWSDNVWNCWCHEQELEVLCK